VQRLGREASGLLTSSSHLWLTDGSLTSPSHHLCLLAEGSFAQVHAPIHVRTVYMHGLRILLKATRGRCIAGIL
jgi:hypothetical protein